MGIKKQILGSVAGKGGPITVEEIKAGNRTYTDKQIRNAIHTLLNTDKQIARVSRGTYKLAKKE